MSDEAETSPDVTDAVAAHAATRLVAASGDLVGLVGQANRDARALATERATMQRFIDHFALDSLFPATAGGGTTTRIDREAVSRDASALDRRIERAQALASLLTVLAQQLREQSDSLSSGTWESPGATSADLRLRQAANAAREEERSRLSREIHDGPAQVLANALFALEIAEQVARRDPTRVADELAQMRSLLRDGVGEIRRFMNGLRPAMLADRGLVATVQRWVADFNRFFGMAVTVEVPTTPLDLTPDQQLALFRIVQEGLQNVQKHAETRHGIVALTDRGDTVELVIRDDGAGIAPGTEVLPSRGEGGGAGLPGMRERARLIGATLTVESSPGDGTTVRVTLPTTTQIQATGDRGRNDTREDGDTP